MQLRMLCAHSTVRVIKKTSFFQDSPSIHAEHPPPSHRQNNVANLSKLAPQLGCSLGRPYMYVHTCTHACTRYVQYVYACTMHVPCTYDNVCMYRACMHALICK